MVTKIHVISGSHVERSETMSGFRVLVRQRKNLRFFAPLRMTFRGSYGSFLAFTMAMRRSLIASEDLAGRRLSANASCKS
jgi:hypothetical protein